MSLSIPPKLRVSLGLVAMGLVACGDAGGPAPITAGSTDSSGSAVAVTGSASAPLAAPEPVVSLDTQAVHALVEAWVAAQNKGDFAAYEKLYAAKLEGIKRSGPRTWRFDRKGFLEDRQRMFKRSMTVEVSDVNVSSGTASALVLLTQRFKQDTFEDVGPKRLVVIEEKGALKIAREEMVQSALAGAISSTKSPFRFVLRVAEKPYAVLGRSADVSWASGPAAWAPRRDAHPAFLMVRPAAAAPATANVWKSSVLKVYDAMGASCEATVRDVALMSGGSPHFGEVQRWDGDPDPDGKLQSPKLSLAQRAAIVFDMAKPHLVGALEVPSGCTPAFALEGDSPVFYKPVSAPAADDVAVRNAKTAFRGLPSYRDNQRSFDELKGKGDWAPKIEVTAFEGGGRRFLALKARVAGACGDFNGVTTALYELTAANEVTLVAENVGAPTAVFDSDGDGAIEMFSKALGSDGIGQYVRTGSGGVVSRETLDFPYNDCEC